jgi:hypothetical protein
MAPLLLSAVSYHQDLVHKLAFSLSSSSQSDSLYVLQNAASILRSKRKDLPKSFPRESWWPARYPSLANVFQGTAMSVLLLQLPGESGYHKSSPLSFSQDRKIQILLMWKINCFGVCLKRNRIEDLHNV